MNGSGCGSVCRADTSIPEVHGSNPVIGQIYIEHLFTVNCIKKTKIKKKEAGNGPLKTLQVKGGSPGLVVMGRDSCSEGHGFESWHRTLDGLFSHIFVAKL